MAGKVTAGMEEEGMEGTGWGASVVKGESGGKEVVVVERCLQGQAQVNVCAHGDFAVDARDDGCLGTGGWGRGTGRSQTGSRQCGINKRTVTSTTTRMTPTQQSASPDNISPTN